MEYTRMHRYVGTVLTLLLSKLGTFFKLSWVLGSAGIMFSVSSFSMPLIGLFGGVGCASLIWTFLLIIRAVSSPLSAASLAFYIPGYCASLYLASENKLLRVGIGLLCMVLFWLHPIGFQAAPYALYWIIPVVIGMRSFKSLFVHALGATFTAHAVGSVIWLYTIPMTAAQWLFLIPLVALERITFAAGTVVMYHVIQRLSLFVSSFKNAFSHYLPLTR